MHTIPNFQVEHPPLLNQVNSYLNNLRKSKRSNNMTDVVIYYKNVWLVRYNQKLLRDYDILINININIIRAQEEISHIQPMYHSEMILDSKNIFYDYLPDIFNVVITGHIVPYIQYNILPINYKLNNTGQIKRYNRIYKGRSIDGRPDYNNIIPNPDRTTTFHTIYMNIWAGDNFYDEIIGQENSEEARIGKKNSLV